MKANCIFLDGYELTGIKLLQERRQRSNKSEIVREAIRRYLKDEGVTAIEIEQELIYKAEKP